MERQHRSLLTAYRGQSIANPDNYIDLEHQRGIITSNCPVGIYKSRISDEQLFVRFNASNRHDTVYLENPEARRLYCELSYLSPEIVGRSSAHRSFSFDQLKAECTKWDPSIEVLGWTANRGQLTFELRVRRELRHLSRDQFGAMLKGEGSNLRFLDVEFRPSGDQLFINMTVPPEPWDLGLSDADVIFTIAYIVTTRMTLEDRRSPVKVSRFCSEYISFVQGYQSQGMLQGKWTEGQSFGITSSDDKVPMAWESTSQIFETFRRINGGRIPEKPGMFQELPRPVRFGQCFIFGCLLQSFMRVLGIPCRAVRTEDSAHDAIRSFIIACKEGETVPVWNFHVWNEVWMSRPDLSASHREYAGPGWQILDATPQGLSYDAEKPQMATGPCPLAAVKKLDPRVPYDTAFVISEVNAVVATYLIRTRRETRGLEMAGGRRDDWFLYDVAKFMCGSSVRRETLGAKTLMYHGVQIPKLVESRAEYIDTKLEPRICITGSRDYTPEVRMLSSTPRQLRSTVELRGVNPNLYIVAAVISYDYSDGPLECDEISASSVQVRELSLRSGKFELNLNMDTVRLVPSCSKNGFRCARTRSDSHTRDCPTHFTVRFCIKLLDASQLINSKASILIYMWSGGRWVNKPGL